MFDDPGAKLKNVAVIEFAVIAAVSFIMAFVLGIHGDDFRPLPFFLLLIGGPLFAYLSALVLYGFGELIDNTEALRLPQKKLEKRLEQQRNERITRAAVEAIADKENESSRFIDILCPFCNEKLSYTKEDFLEKDFLVCPNCEKKIDTKDYTSLYRKKAQNS